MLVKAEKNISSVKVSLGYLGRLCQGQPGLPREALSPKEASFFYHPPLFPVSKWDYDIGLGRRCTCECMCELKYM